MFEKPTNIDESKIDVELLVGQLTGFSYSDLISVAHNSYSEWQNNGYYIENYLASLLLELLNIIYGNINNYLDPEQRYQIALICAGKDESSVKEKTLTKYGKLQPNLDWSAITDRARVLAKALHRVAVIASLSLGDRMWEEYKIIARKFKLQDQVSVEQLDLYARSVNETTRQLLRIVEHALFLKITNQPTTYQTPNGTESAFPKVELYENVVDAAIECLDYFDIFIPVVQKSITEQRNPYMLFIFTQDLVLIFDIIAKKGGALSEKMVRDGAAEHTRRLDLLERTMVWLEEFLTPDYINRQLERPFAKKVSTIIEGKRLGTGALLKVLQSNVAKSTPRVKREAYLIIQELLSRTKAQIGGVNISAIVGQAAWVGDEKNTIDFLQTLNNLSEKGLIPAGSNFSERAQTQLKELLDILQLIETF